MTRRGRTSRKRCHKIKSDSHFVPNQKNTLLQWMKGTWNFKCKELLVAEFQTTGRGLLANRSFQKGDVIVSIPEGALIGVKQACQNSSILKLLLAKSLSGLQTISGVEALCIFLIEEARLHNFAVKHEKPFSKWAPYILSLPPVFDHPIIWCPLSKSLLPEAVEKTITNMHLDVCRQFKEVNKLLAGARNCELKCLSVAEILSNDFTWKEYVWAWCCVNTRCVYSNHDALKQTTVRPSAADNYYMVPFLDLLNHSPSVQVKTGFNSEIECFEIVSMSKIKRHSQVFINYSAHGNDVLLSEYGFVCPNEPNDNDIIRISMDALTRHIPDGKTKTLAQLCNHTQLGEDLTFQNIGASWSLRALVLFLALWESCGNKTAPELRSMLNEILCSNLKATRYNLQLKENAKIILRKVCSTEMDKVKIMIRKCLETKQGTFDVGISNQVNSVLNLWQIYDTMLQVCCNAINNSDNFSEFFGC